MIEVGMWRVYLSAFNEAFPECNSALYRQPTHLDPPEARPWPKPAPCRTYTAGECAQLLPAQSHLDEPLSNSARDFAELRNADAWENSLRTFAPRDPRAPAAITGQQISEEHEALDTNGPEFDFTEAA
jgi:hypothetical protein